MRPDRDRRGRGAGRLSTPAPDGAADGLLRPALEAALAVAREGEDDTPAVPAPTLLRPFLRFAKLPPRALAATRKALDADDEFRERVAEAAEQDDVGRAGWLYLTRPDGWEDELAALVAGAEESARGQADRRAEHDARRRLAAVQEAAQRAEESADAARAEAAEAAATAAEERRARQAAVEAAAIATRQAEEVAAERDRLRAALASMKAEAGSLRRRLAQSEADRQELQSAIERQALATVAVPAVATAPEAGAGESASPEADAGVSERPGGQGASTVPALEDAAEAATRLAEALRAAVAALVAEATPAEPEPAETEPARPVSVRGPATVARRTKAVSSRRPVPLPPAVFDDSVEAAQHLTRVPGIVLLVDGYNVSQAGWPDLAIAEQRRRLVDALAELAARTGAEPRVVFDGSDVAMPGVVPTTAKAVRVTFSPPGVEADDVVIESVGQLPLNRPIVVASSDRRVQAGASRAGANVISTEQLLAVLRR